MKRATRKNGAGSHLEEAMALLINNQAQFVGAMARMQTDIAEIKTILRRHDEMLFQFRQMLAAMPEAVREKIGFKHKEPASPLGEDRLDPGLVAVRAFDTRTNVALVPGEVIRRRRLVSRLQHLAARADEMRPVPRVALRLDDER